MNRKYTGDTYTMNVSGFPFPLKATADHPIAVLVAGDIEWKRSDDIEEGDFVLIGWNREYAELNPLDTAKMLGEDCIILDELMKDRRHLENKNVPNQPNANVTSARHMVRKSGIDWQGKVRLHRSRVENSIFRNVSITPSFGRLIGLYLAEGGCHEGRVTFTFHIKERDTLAAEVLALVRGIFGVEGEIEVRDDNSNRCAVRFQNQNLAGVFKSLMPGNIYSKRVPGLFFGASEEIRLAVLLGWMAGDGYVGVKGGKKPGNVRITGVSVCAGLARDMTVIALSCGLRATAGKRKARQQSKVSYGVDLAGKKAVGLFPAVANRANGLRFNRQDALVTDYGYARKVRSIERCLVEMLPVFDFEVEEDHSFVAGGIVVHNCVGVTGGETDTVISAVQRKVSDNPTKAHVAFWPYKYGMTRYLEGDRGQGEGAVSSVLATAGEKNGMVIVGQTPNQPSFSIDTDGGAMVLTRQQELTWSDGGTHLVQDLIPEGQKHRSTSRGPVYTSADVIAANVNGYPVANGCSMYVNGSSIKGSGADAYVVGKYDSNGGHETSWMGVWHHPNDGYLFLYWNHWYANQYKIIPGTDDPRCSVWVPQSEVDRMLTHGGIDRGEAFAVTGIDGFEPQPKVMDWSQI